MRRLLIIGCGDVAKRALPWLVKRFRVFAAVRGGADDAALRSLGVTPIHADLDCRASLQRLGGLADCLLHFAPPPDHGVLDLRTRRLAAALASRASLPRRISYISTTGVYGDCMGEVVTETRPLRPATPRAKRRVDAERCLRRLARGRGVAVSILRAPGIYAADRLPLERLRRGDPVLCSDDDVFTNHIHADDLARLACFTLFRARGGRVFNAVDHSELRMADYFDLVADLKGLPRPPRLARAEAAKSLSPATLSFMSESRRLSNARLRELRVSLRYPTVREGILAAER